MSLYYKDGAAVSQMRLDLARCEASALSKFPIAPEIDYEWVEICSAPGKCRLHRVPVQTIDLNEGRRVSAIRQCMGKQNYARVQVPACSQDVAAATRPNVTTTMPPLTPESCVIRYKGELWQIVTP